MLGHVHEMYCNVWACAIILCVWAEHYPVTLNKAFSVEVTQQNTIKNQGCILSVIIPTVLVCISSHTIFNPRCMRRKVTVVVLCVCVCVCLLPWNLLHTSFIRRKQGVIGHLIFKQQDFYEKASRDAACLLLSLFLFVYFLTHLVMQFLAVFYTCLCYVSIAEITKLGKWATAEWLRGVVTKLSHPCDC